MIVVVQLCRVTPCWKPYAACDGGQQACNERPKLAQKCRSAVWPFRVRAVPRGKLGAGTAGLCHASRQLPRGAVALTAANGHP